MSRLSAIGHRLVDSTPLEAPTRRVWRRLHGRPAETADAALLAREDMYAAQTEQVLARILRSDSACVDIGAHRGTFLDLILRFAPRGDHYAFEPLPDFAADLRTRYPDVHVEQLALLDVSETRSFRHVRDSAAYSGFARRPWDTYSEKSVELISVEVARLDDVLPPDYVPAFVKIDVEGFDLEVLRGAASVLERARPVVAFEVGFDRGATWQLLAELGMAVFELAVWLQDGEPFPSAAAFEAAGDGWFYLAVPNS